MATLTPGSASRAAYIAAVAIAAIIALHIVFVLIGANPGNTLVNTDANWAATFAAWFKDLFTPSNFKLATFINYGLAAVAYVALGRLLAAALAKL